MRVLIPNLGSTSLKYKLLEFPAEQQLAAGRMERIGRPGGDAASYRDAIAQVMNAVGAVDARWLQGSSRWPALPRHLPHRCQADRGAGGVPVRSSLAQRDLSRGDP